MYVIGIKQGHVQDSSICDVKFSDNLCLSEVKVAVVHVVVTDLNQNSTTRLSLQHVGLGKS